MRILTVFASALALTAAVLTGAQAGDAPARQQPFKTLMARGMRIVAVTVVPAEVNKSADPVVIVTMQLDKTVAVCTFGVAQWENLSQNIEDNPQACDVRNY